MPNSTIVFGHQYPSSISIDVGKSIVVGKSAIETLSSRTLTLLGQMLVPYNSSCARPERHRTSSVSA